MTSDAPELQDLLEQKKGKRSLLQWGCDLLIAVFLLLLLGYLGLHLLANSSWGRIWIEKKIVKSTGFSLAPKGIRLHLDGTLELKELRQRGVGIVLHQVKAKPNLRELWSRRLVWESINVVKLEGDLQLDQCRKLVQTASDSEQITEETQDAVATPQLQPKLVAPPSGPLQSAPKNPASVEPAPLSSSPKVPEILAQSWLRISSIELSLREKSDQPILAKIGKGSLNIPIGRGTGKGQLNLEQISFGIMEVPDCEIEIKKLADHWYFVHQWQEATLGVLKLEFAIAQRPLYPYIFKIAAKVDLASIPTISSMSFAGWLQCEMGISGSLRRPQQSVLQLLMLGQKCEVLLPEKGLNLAFDQVVLRGIGPLTRWRLIDAVALGSEGAILANGVFSPNYSYGVMRTVVAPDELWRAQAVEKKLGLDPKFQILETPDRWYRDTFFEHSGRDLLVDEKRLFAPSTRLLPELQAPSALTFSN